MVAGLAGDVGDWTEEDRSLLSAGPRLRSGLSFRDLHSGVHGNVLVDPATIDLSMSPGE